jgi:hypothetical protein
MSFAYGNERDTAEQLRRDLLRLDLVGLNQLLTEHPDLHQSITEVLDGVVAFQIVRNTAANNLQVEVEQFWQLAVDHPHLTRLALQFIPHTQFEQDSAVLVDAILRGNIPLFDALVADYLTGRPGALNPAATGKLILVTFKLILYYKPSDLDKRI